MRVLLAAIAVLLLAGCASTTTGPTARVYDRKYNQTYSVSVQPESEFVGTGAKSGESTKPSWYLHGHP